MTTKGKARIGIIGVGWWGTVGHLEPLLKDDKAEIVAVQSRSIDKARQRAERFGIPRHYSDYQRMIDECKLDGVIIATTPNVHYEQARYALEHGLHVLMEKPFVLRAAQAEQLGAIARAKGLILSVSSPNCFHPWNIEARRQVRSGALGQIQLMTHDYSQRCYDLFRGDVAALFAAPQDADCFLPDATSYSDPEIAGGGEGHGQTSHAFSVLLYITGLRPTSVFAYMNKLDLAVDVVDTISVRLANGALANVSATGLIPAGMASLGTQILGDRGVFIVETMRRTAHIWLEGEPHPRALDLPSPVDVFSPVPRNFVRAILGEEPIQVEMEVAINVVRILDAAYRSAATGEAVTII